MRVRLSAALVVGQLDLEVVLGITQVNQREIVEVESVTNRKAEAFAVKTDGALGIEHSDHGVDNFRHFLMLASSVGDRIILHERGAVVVARYYRCDLTNSSVAAAHIRPTIASSFEFAS
jgi:hypothetical protein